ncbi:MAG: glycosyltransferase family 4 protein [Chthoniobacteraceae bacterium]
MPEPKSTRRTKRRTDLKVALIHYTSAPVIGGVEAVVSAHALLSSGMRHDSRVIARRGNADVILTQRDPLDELRAAVRGFDAVIVHNVLTMPFDLPLTNALWRLAEEMPDTRWIAWVHDIAACNPDYDHPWHKPPWKRLARASPHFTYVAVSEHRARQFAALTGVEARVIPNGVSPRSVLGVEADVFQFAETHALFARDIVLIQPTRLLRRKNVELGLEVVAELRRRGRDAVTLITAAADPHNAKSNAYAKQMRVRRDKLGLKTAALFVGDSLAVRGDMIASLYAISDALFYPSRHEGFGLPVIEAALHRLPIFCTDIEPIKSLLDRGVHAFAPDASPADVATLIERTLDRSAPHRARWEALRRYSWESIWREHIAPLLSGR